ncbi:unnamed protein product, partial [Pleuronectes platessa]
MLGVHLLALMYCCGFSLSSSCSLHADLRIHPSPTAGSVTAASSASTAQGKPSLRRIKGRIHRSKSLDSIDLLDSNPAMDRRALPPYHHQKKPQRMEVHEGGSSARLDLSETHHRGCGEERERDGAEHGVGWTQQIYHHEHCDELWGMVGGDGGGLCVTGVKMVAMAGKSSMKNEALEWSRGDKLINHR